MIYQLSWKTLPGLRGLSCSEFQATVTDAPDNEKGVALELGSEAERDALLQHLEAVKAHALEWAARQSRWSRG
jgi:hypothetical protein